MKINHFLLLSLLSFLLACHARKTKNSEDLSYEIPPKPPVPPQHLCFELSPAENKTDAGYMDITIIGDSVFGSLTQKNAFANNKRELVGIVFNNLIVVNCSAKIQDSIVVEEQEWELSDDGISQRFNPKPKNDSTASDNQNADVKYSTPMHKVACR